MTYRFLTCLAFIVFAAPAPAAVLVVANVTDGPITFTLERGTGTPETVTLEKGESRPFLVGREATANYTVAGNPKSVRLEAFNAYVFAKRKGSIALQGIDLAGAAVPLGDTTLKPPAPATPHTIKLKLYADDVRTRKFPEMDNTYSVKD